MYSQNSEDDFIADYFGNQTGTLLSIGENDGTTLSNSRLLILKGWRAHLVEPALEPFRKLQELYKANPLVKLHCCAIGDRDYEGTLLVSGSHLSDKDSGLLSTLVPEETKRWKGTEFNRQACDVFQYDTLFNGHKFDFISIDAEGYDVQILYQIPLTDTRCLIIEWNGNYNVRRSIELFCEGYGLKVVKENAENLILVR